MPPDPDIPTIINSFPAVHEGIKAIARELIDCAGELRRDALHKRMLSRINQFEALSSSANHLNYQALTMLISAKTDYAAKMVGGAISNSAGFALGSPIAGLSPNSFARPKGQVALSGADMTPAPPALYTSKEELDQVAAYLVLLKNMQLSLNENAKMAVSRV